LGFAIHLVTGMAVFGTGMAVFGTGMAVFATGMAVGKGAEIGNPRINRGLCLCD
jgi:hypothetical protein